jgi:hypothetical protein
VYEENFHNNCKFRKEAIERVSTNFEQFDRLFVVVQNLINEKGKLSKFNFIRRGMYSLKTNNDVILKIFNRCKTSRTIDYQKPHLMIIKQLLELQVRLKKIKKNISVTNEFKIINHAELFKKDFFNEISGLYKHLIECFQHHIEDSNLFFESLENTLSGTGKGIEVLKSYEETLIMQ